MLTEAQEAFLRAYADHGTIRMACRETGVSRSAHYMWLKDDDYARRFEEAEEQAIRRAEKELARRAQRKSC